MEQKHGHLQNPCCPDLIQLRCGHIVEYCKYHERINNEELLTRMVTSATIIKDEKITISRTYCKA